MGGGEDGLGEGSNGVRGCGWGVASSESGGRWPVAGQWRRAERAGRKVGPCPGMWSGLIELGLNMVVYRGVGTVGWAGRLGCWRPGGGAGGASVAGTVRWLCRWAFDRNGVSREGWLRRRRVGMSIEVDGGRAGRVSTREVDRWRGGSKVAKFSRKIALVGEQILGGMGPGVGGEIRLQRERGNGEGR